MSISECLGEPREIELGAGTIRYRERGAGEPLLFAHGLLASGDLWRKVVPLLADRFRCITPDLPLGSHELSLRPEADLSPPALADLIDELIAKLAPDGVTYVGNDTGGALGQLLVARHPERVKRLVLTPCDAYDNFLPWVFRYLQWSGWVPGGVWLIAQTLRVRAVRRLPIAFGWLTRDPVEAPVSDAMARPIQASRGVRRDTSKVLRGVSTRHTLAAAERFKEFARPVLVAWGRNTGSLFPLEHAERLAAAFPRARLEVIDDALGFVPEDQPAKLAELIGRFVAETA